MKVKIICILVMTLLIVTALPAIGTMNEKEISVKSGIRGNIYQQNIKNPIPVDDRGALFIQLPVLPDDPWAEVTTDSNTPYQVFDDFWEITSPICDIHWWGEFWREVGGQWYGPFDPEGSTFNITFYKDDDGMPGDVACSYIDISPSYTGTGLIYEDAGLFGMSQAKGYSYRDMVERVVKSAIQRKNEDSE